MGRRKKATNKEQLLEELIQAIRNLTEVESKIDEYVKTIDELNLRLCDIVHYMENPKNKLTKTGSINLANELRVLRQERRQVKQMWELWRVYGANREKLKQKDYREFLITDLLKADKALQTEYNYRVFSEEELNVLNGKKISYNNKEEEESDGE